MATLFALSEPARATLIPVAQERSISASAGVDATTDSDSSAAPDLAPFSDSVEALVSLGYVARGFASQDSTIAPSLVVAEGSTEAAGDASFDSSIDASGYSEFSVSFELEDESHWAIDAAVDVSGIRLGIFFAEVRLAGPSGQVFALFDEDQISDLFVLAPGTYVLTARASSDAFPSDVDGDSGAASFSVRLEEVPEPGPLALLGAGVAGLAGSARRIRVS
jgi:hypothetical protein